jgi:hypothetical protein
LEGIRKCAWSITSTTSQRLQDVVCLREIKLLYHCEKYELQMLFNGYILDIHFIKRNNIKRLERPRRIILKGIL